MHTPLIYKPSCCELIKRSFENLINAPHDIGTIVPVALNAITSVVTTPLSCITLGKWKFINKIAQKSHSSNLIFTSAYIGLISILNPKINQNKLKEFISKNPEGLLTFFIVKSLFDKAQKLSSKKSFCKRHIVSRVLFALGGLLSIITRIADAAIGLIAALLVAVTLARVEFLNNVALKCLITFPGVFHDVLTGIRGIFHPGQSYLNFTPRSKNYNSII
jgi:hypothetical protein